MCGIIYAKNLIDNHPVNNLVKILYENQKERGQLGFGFVGLNAEQIGTYRATDEEDIMKYLNEHQYDEFLFHHRLPTSTRNTLKSTHPFVIEMDDKRYYFMHNGIIQNADQLKERHSKEGIAYSSEEGEDFNDSEALAWDFCLWLNNKQEKVIAEGSVAFVCLEINMKTSRAEKLYFYRNDEAQLKIYKDKTLLLLASEGNYAPIKENWLCFWDYQKGQMSRYGFLDIQCPNLFSFNQYDCGYFDEELEIEDDIMAMEQERDYLLGMGEHIKAGIVDDEIEDLKCLLKEAKRDRLYLDSF
jgi:predicted glutamine amidotransferase